MDSRKPKPQLLTQEYATRNCKHYIENARREFWDVLAELSNEGMTIVVATPYLDEASRCDRIALMYDGEIHEISTPKELRDNLGLHRLEVHTTYVDKVEQVLLEAVPVDIADVQTFGDRLDILVKDTAKGEVKVRQLLQDNNLPSPNIESNEPTLENVFVTRLRQQGSAPEFFPFPRYRGGNRNTDATRDVTCHVSTSSFAIYAHNLSRVFGKFQAVNRISC